MYGDMEIWRYEGTLTKRNVCELQKLPPSNKAAVSGSAVTRPALYTDTPPL